MRGPAKWWACGESEGSQGCSVSKAPELKKKKDVGFGSRGLTGGGLSSGSEWADVKVSY